MSIDFSTLQGLTIPEGVVTEIKDSLGRVIWAAGGKIPARLAVKKVTATTYAGETSYPDENFILLSIYPEKYGTVKVTYGGLTKTIKDTSGADAPNAQQVFFGTFNGVTDNITTPDSGELIIEGKYRGYGRGHYTTSSKGGTDYCACITSAIDFGEPKIITDSIFHSITDMTTIKLPECLEEIGSSVFYGCTGLTSITIPSNVKSIGSSAFYGCTGLTSITIPSNVKSIGSNAFYGCTGLTEIHTPDITSWLNIKFGTLSANPLSLEGAPKLYVNGSVVTNVTILNNYEGSYTFAGYTTLTAVSFGAGIMEINLGTFSGCTKLTLSSLPSGLTNIGAYAFDGCTGITLNSLPSGITSIGSSAFRECTGITLNSLPSGLTSIEDYTFYGCTGVSLSSLPSGITNIGERAFNNTKLTLNSLPSNLKTIGNYALMSQKDITINSLPSGITTIGEGAFSYCSGITITSIPSGVTVIGNSTFKKCTGLTRLTMDSVQEIGNSAFSDCTNLTSVSMLGIVTISQLAFKNERLTSIVFGANLASIQFDAFYQDEHISRPAVSVVCKAPTPPALDDDQDVLPYYSYSENYRVKYVYVSNVSVPKGSLSAYTSSNWAGYTNSIVEES